MQMFVWNLALEVQKETNFAVNYFWYKNQYSEKCFF